MLKKDEIKYIINQAEPLIFVVEDALIPNVTVSGMTSRR